MKRIRSILFKAVLWLFKDEILEATKEALDYYRDQQCKLQAEGMIIENKVVPIKIKAGFLAPPLDCIPMCYTGERILEETKAKLLEDAKKHISVKQFGREVTLKLTVLPKDWDEQ